MSSINSGYSRIYIYQPEESKPKESAQPNSSESVGSSTSVQKSGLRMVSRSYLKGEHVNEQSLLGKLRQKLGHANQLAVHRSDGSGALFATGVSRTRFQKLESRTENEARANLVAAERILKAAKIDVRGMNADQKTRLAVLTAREPRQAFEVIARAKGDTKDLNVLLETAELTGLDTQPLKDRVQSKRDQLTNPTTMGGLGIDPQKLAVVKELGRGNFGAVHLYKDPDSDRLFAGKVLASNGEVGAATIEQEEEMLARLPNHENLVKSYGIHTINNQPVLLQEFVPGDDLEKIFVRFDWKQLTAQEQQLVLKHVATQIFRGLAELQKLGIAHEDVRGANLFFDSKTLTVKLGDFGLARDRGTVKDDPRPLAWAPPETLAKNDRRASVVEDTFSASRVLVGELVPHTNLFNKEVTNDRMYGLKNELPKLIGIAISNGGPPSALHSATRDVLNKMDPTEKMPDFFAAISHPDPSQRLRADQALKHEFLSDPLPQDDLKIAFKKILSNPSTATPANSMDSQQSAAKHTYSVTDSADSVTDSADSVTDSADSIADSADSVTDSADSANDPVPPQATTDSAKNGVQPWYQYPP